MQSTRKKVGLAGVLLFVLLGGIYAVFGWFTSQQRLAAEAALHKPESIKIYEAIANARENVLPSDAATNSQDGSKLPPPQMSSLEVRMAENRIEAYDACQKKMRTLNADAEWKSKWDEICLRWNIEKDELTEEQWQDLGEVLAKVQPLFTALHSLCAQKSPIRTIDKKSFLSHEQEPLATIAQSL